MRLQGERRAGVNDAGLRAVHPAPLPGPGEAYPPGAGSSPPGVPVVPNETYILDSGAIPTAPKKPFVRLTRRFGGVMSTVMVPTDYPVQPGDTIYVLERLF